MEEHLVAYERPSIWNAGHMLEEQFIFLCP